MKRSSTASSSTGTRKAARSEKTCRGKKSPIFWDSDGVDGGKSSLRVVLDWYTNPTNYGLWCGSDRSNGNTKEALLIVIMQRLEAAGIRHRNKAGVREKISNLEKQYREAEHYLASTEARDADETSRRAAVLSRCPHYDELHKVMSRPAAANADAAVAPRRRAGADRPLVVRQPADRPLAVRPPTNPPLAADRPLPVHPPPPQSLDRPLAAHPALPNRPLAVHPPPAPGADSVQWLKDQQAAVLRAYGEQRAIQEREHNLKEKELKLKEQELKLKEKEKTREDAHAEIELALKRVQLESAQREAMVQLLLSRKKLQDNGVAQHEIDRLLPLP